MESFNQRIPATTLRNLAPEVVCILCLLCTSGCWAPLHTYAIPASALPDTYRIPRKGFGPALNFANLTARPSPDYILGPNDVLDVTVPDLFEGAEVRPLRVQVMANQEVHLPLVGAVRVGGRNLLEAQKTITDAYADGIFEIPRVNVSLAQKATVEVLVLGEVNNPGIKSLPKYQNDVGHALAAAEGIGELAEDMIEIHRRIQSLSDGGPRLASEEYDENPDDPKKILRISLRNPPAEPIHEQDILLNPGDVVVVPSRRHEVFWVVGQLDQSNLVRFTLGDRERELGAGLVLPRDRDIDVVTAVAMAGYIDPIDSPTTVTVQRNRPFGDPILIRVDLIRARYSRRETILVEPGDIIYVNPDAPWWLRRTFDRIIPDLILLPYAEALSRALIGKRGSN